MSPRACGKASGDSGSMFVGVLVWAIGIGRRTRRCRSVIARGGGAGLAGAKPRRLCRWQIDQMGGDGKEASERVRVQVDHVGAAALAPD